MKFAGVLSRRLVSYLSLQRHGGWVRISDYMEMEISMAFISVKGLCFIIVMRRNVLELEGRRRYIINTPFISKLVLSSPFNLYTHR